MRRKITRHGAEFRPWTPPRYSLARDVVKQQSVMMTNGTEDGKPTSLAEAVEILRSTYPQDQLDAWAAEPLSEALWKAHFQLGLWIRNEWVHTGPAPFVRRMRRLFFFVHDDDVSGYVLEALWRVLNGEDCPTIEELLERRYPGCRREPSEE